MHLMKYYPYEVILIPTTLTIFTIFTIFVSVAVVAGGRAKLGAANERDYGQYRCDPRGCLPSGFQDAQIRSARVHNEGDGRSCPIAFG
jgi:hypothetical protein